MDQVEVSTVVYLEPEAVYEFLLEFPRYAGYSEHLRSIDRDGDGGPGTDYRLTFAWWRLSYTAHARVVAVDPPTRIDWRLVEDLDARGYWLVEPAPDEVRSPDEPASRVRLHVRVRPDSVDPSVLELPRFVSLDWVVERARPRVEAEAERVVRRVVADLEGEARPVDVQVRTGAG